MFRSSFRQGNLYKYWMFKQHKCILPTAIKRDNISVCGNEPSSEKLEKKAYAVSFHDIVTAQFRIRDGIENTSCKRSVHLSKKIGVNLFLKKDYRQISGSFKERGARNALMQLPEEERRNGVIAASAGNHALALAYHGREIGIPITVVMPTIAPLTKINNCKDYGANVILHGIHILEARDYANLLVEKEGKTYINGFDHPDIIAGAGTMGIEILSQVPFADAIVVPVGGGGLIAGLSLAAKTLNPSIEIIGVEPENCASLSAALKAGKPVDTPTESTLADGLAVPIVGSNAFSIARDYVDRVVTIPERAIALGVLRLVELEKVLVEGGGAIGLAAILEGTLPELQGKNVVLPLCGGNIDTTVLGRVIERGLAADGRLVRFVATVSDRPGGIAALASLMGKLGVSIKDIYHERAWLQSNLSCVQVKCVVETTSRDHAMRLKQTLLENEYPLIWSAEDVV